MIEKNASTPMYEQIAAVLRREILQKKYGDRGCIGTHAELTQRFGVSMITVRKAVQLLHEEKLVDIKQGKGTFVRSTLLHDNLSCLTGASNIMQASKLPALVSVPVFETIDTPRHLDADLRAGLGRRCLHITRIHSVDGTPLSYAELYLPGLYSRSITKNDIERFTVYQIYQDKLRIPLGVGRQSIRAARAGCEAARALDIELDSPVLEIERRAYSADGKLIEYMLMTYEYTKYSFEVELRLSAT